MRVVALYSSQIRVQANSFPNRNTIDFLEKLHGSKNYNTDEFGFSKLFGLTGDAEVIGQILISLFEHNN